MAEREWREASDMRPPTLALAIVLATAAALRVWGLRHGLPDAVAGNEAEMMAGVVHMMKTGDYRPPVFDLPTLYPYVQLAAACVRFLAGSVQGLWHSLEQVEPSDFYFWGRTLTALAGAATVFVVFQIGARWGARHALLAAGLMAVMPAHVRESHFVLPDVPLTFFVALAFLLALKANEAGTLKAFAWAGVAAGLATATMYHGAATLLLPVVAAFGLSRSVGSPSRRILATLGGFAAAFIAATPYALLDLPGFLDGFARMAAPGAGLVTAGGSAWAAYLSLLLQSLAWPGLLLFFGGLVLGLVRIWKGPGQMRSALLVTFPIAYFALIASRRQAAAPDLLPILPFACLMAAIAVVSGVSLLRRWDIPRVGRTALIAGLTVAALLPPAIRSVAIDRELRKTPTQAIAYDWITQHVSPGSRLVVESAALHLPPGRYRTDYVETLIDRGYEDYATGGVHYMVTSDAWSQVLAQPEGRSQEYTAYRKLLDGAEEMMRVERSSTNPGPEFRVFRIR
jgi:4-amino-4-deoxy-L-arabinose transferase-like glycosyltransferase